MSESIAKRLSRRFRRNPEPDEVAIVLAAEPGGSTADVDLAKTNARTPQGVRNRGMNLGGGGQNAFPMHDNRDRISGYREYRRLDANIPEAGAALDIISTSAIGGEPGSEVLGFDLEYAPEFPDADQEFTDRMVDHLGLKQLVKPLVRSSNKLGDVFFHVIVDNLGRVLKLKYLEPDLTFMILDKFGDFMGWEYRGYEDRERVLMKWEVIHLAHLPELGASYGRAIFASGLRSVGFSLQSMRDSAMVQVVKNATGQVAMTFGVPSTMPQEDRLARLEEMYELSARAPVMIDGKLDRRVIEGMPNEQPLILLFDVFPDGKGVAPGITELSPANLTGIVEMLENFQDQFFIPLKVPKSQMGIERGGEGLGGNRLSTQMVEFAKYLNAEQHDVVWFVLYVISLQYWLIGRPLKVGMITVVMADLAFLDTLVRAEIRKVAMETAAIAKQIGLSDKYIWTEILWDGDSKTALEMADKYGVDLDAEPEPMEQPEGEEPPDDDDVEEAARRATRHLAKDLALIQEAAALVAGARGSNS